MHFPALSAFERTRGISIGCNRLCRDADGQYPKGVKNSNRVFNTTFFISDDVTPGI